MTTLTSIKSTESVMQKQNWVEVAKEIGPKFAERAAQHDQEGSFVQENYDEMRQRKLFSARIPLDLGGGGGSHREMCQAIREIAHHDGSTALSFSMHSHLLAGLVWHYDKGLTPSVEPVLRKIADEELILVSTGSRDWLDGSGTAEKVDGGYKVSGRKFFSSGSSGGDLIMTTAIYDDPKASPTVLHFATSLKGEGVTIVEDWNTMGMRGTGSNSVVLEDVFVPEASISLSRPSGKWMTLFDVISPIAWSLVMSAYLGVAEAARDITIAQVQKKKEDHIVQEIVGEMDTELLCAQTALKGIVDLLGPDFIPSTDSSNLTYRYKTITVKSAIRSVEKAMEAVGGMSFYRQVGLERCFRDIQGARFHPFQERKQYSFSGRIALGLEPID